MIFDSARWHTRLSIWSDEWKNLPADQAHDEARREADRAVEQLQQAVDSGFADLEASGGTMPWTRSGAGPTSRNWSRTWKSGSGHVPREPLRGGARVRAGTPKALSSRAERVSLSRADRAAVLYAAGVLQHDRRRPQEARAALVEARSACEQLLQARPSDARIQTLQAGISRALATLD